MATLGVNDALPLQIPTTDDGAFFEHEEEVARNPHSIHAWVNYLKEADTLAAPKRFALYERGVVALPRSYKLWKQYLDEYYETQVRGKRIDAVEYTHLVALYERALVQLNKMPRIWLDFIELVQEMKRVAFTRHAFDRALRALPITQHHRIWRPYLEFVKHIGLPQVAVRVYRRYLMLEPGSREEYVDYLTSIHQYDEASRQLIKLIDNQSVYPTKRTTHSLWMQLCDMISQHPEEVSPSLNVEAILRSGITQFTDEVGRLWCSLATYFVRLGMFESARDIYEEGIRTVMTVRDFSMIFDAYVKFIEAMLTAEMELAENPDDNDEDDDVDHQVQVDRFLKIYEDVADRRPILLNSVLLRQNPHNVREWEKRVELQKTDLQKVIRTYAEAVKTVDPAKSGGRLHTLWVKFAKFYEDHKDIANARVIFKKAADVEYRSDQELANVYCEWAEMELRQDNFEEPLEILRGACAMPASMTVRLRNKTGLTTKDKVHKNVKLWGLRLDLEESLGDIESTRAAYNDAFELKIVTPQMVLNFASYLEENKFFEESFRVYERGLSLFPSFPYANEIWQAYLTKFVKRYGGTKVERARDLHEQALKAAPSKFAKAFYAKYAEFEEKHGMLRNVMAIYERATDAVPEEEQVDVYAAYVKKAQKFFGVSKVRDVYQRGIANLPDKYVASLCLKFADMETKLGEIERARAIYTHASQFCDPRQHEASFWKVWHDFEVAHGSEHSFLEMLRIKRSVVAQYSQVNYVSAEIAPVVVSAKPAGMVPASSATTNGGDAMAVLEANLVDATLEEQGSNKRKANDIDEEDERPAKQQHIVQVQNDEEIDLDDEEDDDEEDDDEEDGNATNETADEIEERGVPETVYGASLKKKAS
uniref:Suppressor of forked domain-containing protein n=1 Tax=Globisporangium ultimum (strain ATCC 200006 / CBS 805.95 / DAOM BR144) TaxID=431595 RepID=K3WEH0_GLOUD